MAHRICRVGGLITNITKTNNAINNAAVNLLKPPVYQIQNARNTSNFFCKLPASSLWKSVTSVSNAGKRRGRAKGVPRMKNLNRGQIIGQGKVPILLPGLNAPVMQGEHLTEHCRRLPVDPNREQHLIQLQTAPTRSRRTKLHPLERGWTGASICGRKMGPPDPIDGEPFEGFETSIVHFKTGTVMTSNLGRVKRISLIMVGGNEKGLVGFATKYGSDPKACIKAAKNRIGQRLLYVERHEERTVLHSFYTRFSNTKIFVHPKPKGYGLVCHRVIKTICELIGITDLYAKIEGSTNTPNIVRAFFIGLLQQKTHQQLANEKKLHLVEFKGKNSYPEVVASPDTVRKPEELEPNEILDLTRYALKGKVILRKKKPPPFYTKLKSYTVHRRKMERNRDQDQVRIRLRTEYGAVNSFLTEKYPEAKPFYKASVEEGT